MENYTVKEVSRKEYEDLLLNVHYAGRYPSISYAYGLYKESILIGVVTYGTPSSSTLRKGIAGEEFISNVLELNRLCLYNNLKNEASYLVSRSLKLLPKQRIVISFADCSQGHVGYVYQACNFSYHGLSAKRTDWALYSKPHLHGQTIGDEFRGQKGRAALMREKYGEDFYLKPRPRKYRYIYLTGSKKWKKKLTRLIKYPQDKYPKNLKGFSMNYRDQLARHVIDEKYFVARKVMISGKLWDMKPCRPFCRIIQYGGQTKYSKEVGRLVSLFNSVGRKYK